MIDMVKVDAAAGAFLIGMFPVTQAQWKSLIGSNPSRFKGLHLPVEQVTWLDSIAFCNALSKKEGRKPCYFWENEGMSCDFHADGYRLPTEAEWLHAARGGFESKGYAYAGSDDPDQVAWYLGNSFKKTHEVGKKRPNELGIHDMSGNVYEWCWDWYHDAEGEDPTAFEPSSRSRRVLKGGTCLASSYRVRCQERWSGHPEYGYELVGLRLVRSL